MEIEWMTNFYSLIRFQMKSIRYNFEEKKEKEAEGAVHLLYVINSLGWFYGLFSFLIFFAFW